MRTKCARPGKIHRTDQKRELWLPGGLPRLDERWRLSSLHRLLITVLAPVLLFGIFAPALFAIDNADAPDSSARLHPINAARTTGLHAAHSELQTSRLWSLIEQIRFNQQALQFDQGITAGPGAGDLEIQLAAPVSGTSDHLRYRLLGVDDEWKETGRKGDILYSHLEPGHYEFDFQLAESGGLRGSVVQAIPITIIAPYWQTARFRALCAALLLAVVLLFYMVHVGYLARRNRKLQEKVSQTRAELTLTAKMAGDAQEALKEQALKDSLTGLWNRRAIFAMLEREIFRAQRDHFPITLVMIDLDHFKNINDTHGHLTGDDVLRETAARLTEAMRPYDFAGRYGGEEFLVVLPSCSPQNGLQRAEHFRRAIADKMLPTANGPLAVTCSLGVAAYEEAMPPEDLIQRADEALYRAKHNGRNCVCTGN